MRSKNKFSKKSGPASRSSNKRTKKRDIRESKTVVEGIITASEWDKNGNVMELRLQTTDEEEYLIVNGELFTGLVRKYVLATGSVDVLKNGTQTIHIKKCTIVDNESDDNLIIENI